MPAAAGLFDGEMHRLGGNNYSEAVVTVEQDRGSGLLYDPSFWSGIDQSLLEAGQKSGMGFQPPDTVRVDTKQIGVNQRLSGEAGILVWDSQFAQYLPDERFELVGRIFSGLLGHTLHLRHYEQRTHSIQDRRERFGDRVRPHFRPGLFRRTHSSVCAWAMSPGPSTTTGMPACASQPASVAYGTPVASQCPNISPAILVVTRTISESIWVSIPGSSSNGSSISTFSAG